MTRDVSVTDLVSVVVPARNEAATITKVIETLTAMPVIGEVIVVDNGSQDNTVEVAIAAGARVLHEARPGMGHAIRTGFIAATYDWVMKVDADLDRFDIAQFSRMADARAPGVGLVKGVWQNPKDNMPMTRLLVMPAMRQMFPGLGNLNAPNSGIYVFDRTLIALNELVGDYAADLDVMLRMYATGATVIEVDIGRIEHDPRDLGHYNAMAETILAFFLRQNELRITQEKVVIAQSAEDVILSALGGLAAHSKSGGCVTIYLEDVTSAGVHVLRDVLSPFPTARVCPLSELQTFDLSSASMGLTVMMSYPQTSTDSVFKAASHMVDAITSIVPVDLLFMPPGKAPQSDGQFTGDVALAIGNGAEIKQAALIQVGLDGDGYGPAPREIFQSKTSYLAG